MHKANQKAKQFSELGFWTQEYLNSGALPSRFDFPETRYREQLRIDDQSFVDQIVVDIGCGPVGALRAFDARLKFGIDVLARSYRPFGIADHGMIYLAAPAEDLPFIDEFADVVISLNALDHVDDFESSVREIHRVLKVGGRIFLGFNLDHKPTVQEPQLLSQDRILRALGGMFRLSLTEVIELEPESRIQAPGGLFVVHGERLPSEPSLFQQTTLLLLDEIKQQRTSTESRDLDYVLRYGAPKTITGERAAATAFVEYRLRHPGWRKRLLRAVLIAFVNEPRLIRNRGIWSILFRALISRQ